MKFNYRTIWVVLFLCAITFAQKQNLQFSHLTSQDGLGSNTVFSILQDNKGFLWFGTYDGLSRYDGYNFHTFKTVEGDSASISDNKIRVMIKDKASSLWIGTWYNGLNKFDPKTEKFKRYLHNANDNSSLSNNNIISLCEDRDGNIWIGTGGGGLNKFDVESGKFFYYKNDPDDPLSLSSDIVYSIYEDNAGILWIGTGNGGLNRFDKNTETLTLNYVTGGTISISGFSDVFVTGGTYSAGTATFTNNTGGTFDVSGFFTGGSIGSDVFVTGSTYNNNTFTFTNNTGGTFDVSFNIVTGLTINGNLNISGDTEQVGDFNITVFNFPRGCIST